MSASTSESSSPLCELVKERLVGELSEHDLGSSMSGTSTEYSHEIGNHIHEYEIWGHLLDRTRGNPSHYLLFTTKE